MLNEFFLRFKCEKCGNILTKVYPARTTEIMMIGLKDKPNCRNCENKKNFLILEISNVKV